MPKAKVAAPLSTPYTDSSFGIASDMIDDDNMHGVESQFYDNACIYDGCSGKKPIDTRFENISQDIVDAPRSARKDVSIAGMMPDHEGVDNPAPVPADLYLYPHRR